MGRVESYYGTWIFRNDTNESGANPAAYPPGHLLIIGRQGADQLTLSWLDIDNDLHTLAGLRLAETSGFLHAARAEDLPTKTFWKVTIAFQLSGGAEGGPRITGSVEPADRDFGESNLTGNWGADAPPPPEDWLARILRWLRRKR